MTLATVLVIGISILELHCHTQGLEAHIQNDRKCQSPLDICCGSDHGPAHQSTKEHNIFEGNDPRNGSGLPNVTADETLPTPRGRNLVWYDVSLADDLDWSFSAQQRNDAILCRTMRMANGRHRLVIGYLIQSGDPVDDTLSSKGAYEASVILNGDYEPFYSCGGVERVIQND